MQNHFKDTNVIKCEFVEGTLIHNYSKRDAVIDEDEIIKFIEAYATPSEKKELIEQTNKLATEDSKQKKEELAQTIGSFLKRNSDKIALPLIRGSIFSFFASRGISSDVIKSLLN